MTGIFRGLSRRELLTILPLLPGAFINLARQENRQNIKEIKKVATQEILRLGIDGYKSYWWQGHHHTNRSYDACGETEDAYRKAFYDFSIDALAVTEHHNGLPFPELGAPWCREEERDPDKWGTLRRLSDQYNKPGFFSALRGFEYTRDEHYVVYNSEDWFAPLTPDEFYSRLSREPSDVIASFPHPLPKEFGGIGDFSGFRGFPSVYAKIRLIEMATNQPFEDSYRKALSNWLVSAVGYGDSHVATQMGHQYGFFARENTREELLEALRKGRTFGTTDGNIAIAMFFDDQWMGSGISTDRGTLRVYAMDRKGEDIERIELLKNGLEILESWNPDTSYAECTFPVDGVEPGDFFYAVLRKQNGHSAWSGSIVRPKNPQVWLNPATFKFDFEDPNPQTLTTLVETNDGEYGNIQAIPMDDFIQVSRTERPNQFAITIDPSVLSRGTYTSGIKFFPEERRHQPSVAGIQINYGTDTKLKLEVSPRTIELSTSADDPRISCPFSIRADDFPWYVDTDVDWLQGEMDEGRGSSELIMNINLDGRDSGLYVGNVEIKHGAEVRCGEVKVAHLPHNPRIITLQNGLDGYDRLMDTYISEWEPDTSFGLRTDLKLRTGEPVIRTLIRTDLPDLLLQDSEIYSAVLELYCHKNSRLNYFEVYQLLRPWNEGATWIDTGMGDCWSEAGAMRKGEDISISPIEKIGGNSENERYLFDVTKAVREWTQYPEDNQGLLLTMRPGVYNGVRFRSSNWDREYRPRLVVVYGDQIIDPTIKPTPTPIPEELRKYIFLPLAMK